VDCLTKQERRVLVTILALLLIGGATKLYRAMQPAGSTSGQGATTAGTMVSPAKP
jgi:hypothetical protein